MARTLKKTEMEDIFGFTTPLALSELEFFAPLATRGIEDSIFDDVYSELVGKEDAGNVCSAPETISAGELLEELDLKGGDGIVEAGWMTDKINFTVQDTTALITDTRELAELDSGFKLQTIDSSFGDFLIGVSQDSSVNSVLMAADTVSPLSPEQKVPDFAPLSPLSSVADFAPLSPLSSVLSPMSAATDDSGISFASLDDDVAVAELFLSCGTAAVPVDTSEPSTVVNSLTIKSPNVEVIQSSGGRTTQTPYSRNKITPPSVKPKVKTPHQRMRKREQNKDAATRYRVKKRGEQELLLTECEDLETVNKQLNDQADSLSKEIDYLKNLMLEVYKTRLQKQQLDLAI